MSSSEQWWELGACRTANPAVFDGHKIRHRARSGKLRVARDWSAAKKLCGSCTVRAQCLDYVLNLPETLWPDDAYVAGYTPEEIQILRKKYKEKRR